VLCKRCARLSPGGRKLPPAARDAMGGWMTGQHLDALTGKDALAHQRLLREFLGYHLHDDRALRAFDLWDCSQLSSVESREP
jgi:hypothetical protein